jgi:hypothetical protein
MSKLWEAPQQPWVFPAILVVSLVGVFARSGMDRLNQPPTPAECVKFQGGRMDPKHTGRGKTGSRFAHFRLYRSKAWDSADVIKDGKWIGAIHNTGGTPDSGVFDIGSGQTGCVHLGPLAPQGLADTATAVPGYLVTPDSSIPVLGLVCLGLARNTDSTPPHTQPRPNECTEIIGQVRTTNGIRTVRAIYKGGKLVGAEPTADLPREYLAQLKAAATGTGAWFPCSSNGCCRAY